MLLRHWTLYDSIMNSTYTVASMRLTSKDGADKMKEFLVKINCPIEDAKQQWTFMNPEIKNRVKVNISAISESFGMRDILMNSFSLQLDSQLQLSATDMAYAVTALLENPIDDNKEEGDNENSNPNNGANASTASSAFD